MSFDLNNSGKQKLAEILNKKALQVVREAKRNAPVDTGRLRSSITAELVRRGDIPKVKVGSNVDYAAAQEFGTENMPAQPYLRPALRKVFRTGSRQSDFDK